VTDMGDLDRTIDELRGDAYEHGYAAALGRRGDDTTVHPTTGLTWAETTKRDAADAESRLRALVSELVRQNKALSTERDGARADATYFKARYAAKLNDERLTLHETHIVLRERDIARREATTQRDRNHEHVCRYLGHDPLQTSKMLLPWESVVGPSGATGGEG
jgi:hypothetical protein